MKNFLILICFCLFCACSENNNDDNTGQQLCYIKYGVKYRPNEEYLFYTTIGFEYDANGNIVKEFSDDNFFPGEIIYTYDDNSRKIKEESDDYSITWSYDQSGRLLTKITEEDPASEYYKHRKENYAYNKQGQMESYENHAEYNTTYNYTTSYNNEDPVNLFFDIRYFTDEFHQYSYDSSGKPTNETVDRSIVPVVVYKSEEEVPDHLGENKNFQYSVDYVYDTNGFLKEKAVKCDVVNGYTPNEAGWLSSESNISINASDIDDERFFNTWTFSGYNQFFNQNARNLDIGFNIDIDQCSDLSLSFQFVYDDNGNITHQSWLMDDFYYPFDPYYPYNPTSKNYITWSYFNEYQNATQVTYSYGDTIEQWTYSYDDEGRLSENSYYSKYYNKDIFYTYDENGRPNEEFMYDSAYGMTSEKNVRYIYGNCTKE